ncbi:hypothetical protein [Sphingomicrobium arenosum]|uniref:hypothetical protein n=1 Tax=Sphingomicrobium arenosum TaxID=2233861 RepID=UPI002240FD10|nr:hypothetical protein [Sphingomicrobium arenosum]
MIAIAATSKVPVRQRGLAGLSGLGCVMLILATGSLGALPQSNPAYPDADRFAMLPVPSAADAAPDHGVGR